MRPALTLLLLLQDHGHGMNVFFSKASISMSSTSLFLLLFSLLGLLTSPLSALDQDGVLLLSFKHSILSDPLSALSDWNYDDETPCSWNGVMCMGFPDPTLIVNSTSSSSSSTSSRVISLVLPNARLLGSIAPDVGLIEHLRHLDLSGNLLNGTLPASLFNASTSPELKVLSLADNEISGEIPDTFGNATGLRLLNLSDNALTGRMPASLSLVPNISVVSLRSNFLSGRLSGGGGGFLQVQVLDLSSNLLNGSLPADLVGSTSTSSSIQYLNLSSNRFSGEIPSELGMRMPAAVVVDFSFNNFTGGIPNAAAFLSQKPVAFAGNPDLCGKPLKSYCVIPSTLSNPPNVSAANPPPESPPAFAAIPKTTMGDQGGGGGGSSEVESGRGTGREGGFTPATIVAIVIGDLGGVGLLVVAFLYAYHVKKRNQQKGVGVEVKAAPATAAAAPPCESKLAHCGLSCCLRKKDNDGQEESTETSSSSETDDEEGEDEEEGKGAKTQGKQRGATLVTFDGDTELEMETLLKSAAYILGATGTTIVYKAVLSDGTALAVRRIGECGAAEKLKDFKVQVRSIARVRHPNLLRIWGFYWGPDERLLIHDYAANGSLASISSSKKMGSSPFNLNWEARLKIARGLARGVAYIHEKKSVHGNIKPSNILLGSDMEAKIGDFGLDRLLSGGGRPGSSARLFGSKRSMHSQTSLPESSPVPGASPLGATNVFAATGSSSVRYQAPELLKNLKPNAKCDVYSFGVVLLELISGRVFSEEELSQWNAGGVVAEERNRILRMADPALRGEVGGRREEEALLGCFKLGFACAAAAPQRRPTMKDAVVLLDRLITFHF